MFEIRSDRTSQWTVKLVAERPKYFELIRQGMGNTRTCAIVGVDERTGRAWRAGKPKEPTGTASTPRRSAAERIAHATPSRPCRIPLSGPRRLFGK
jgi:IS30 family transposase